MSSITEPWTAQRCGGVSNTADFQRLSLLNTWEKYLGRTDPATGQTNERKDLAWICSYKMNNIFLNQLVQRHISNLQKTCLMQPGNSYWWLLFVWDFFLLNSSGTPDTLIFLSIKSRGGLNMPHSCSSLPLLCPGEANLRHSTFILQFCEWAPKLQSERLFGARRSLSLLHDTIQHIFCCRCINRGWIY